MSESDHAQTRARERRRTARNLRKTPLRVELGEGTVCDASPIVVSRNGALVLSPDPLIVGTIVRITNRETGFAQMFRVVWRGEPSEGLYKIGVEMLHPELDFWGAEEPYSEE